MAFAIAAALQQQGKLGQTVLEDARPPTTGEGMSTHPVELKINTENLGQGIVSLAHTNSVKMQAQEWGVDQTFGLVALAGIAYVIFRIKMLL